MLNRLILLILLSGFLAGCNKNPLEVTVSRCPAVAVVADAGVFTSFDGEIETTDKVRFHASILNVDVSCQEGSDVRAAISFDIDVRRGPAFEGDTVTLPYFVAVLKDNATIVSKKSFEVTYRLDEDGVNGREIISQYIPSIEQARRYNYEVLVGFVLDPADIAFNMRR